MSVHLGMTPTVTNTPDFNAKYASGKAPAVSYMYKPGGKSYLFEEPDLDQFSLIPAIDLQSKTVIFTINQKPAIHYDNAFIYSLTDLFKKVKLPQKIDQDLLDKIAIIANYLAHGEEYEYVSGTAKEKDKGLNFLVEHDKHKYKVSVPSFEVAEGKDIKYEEVSQE